MDTLLIFFLNRSFLERKIKNRFFKIRESLPFLYINLKWRAKFQIYRLRIRDSDLLDFMHFSGYKHKIRLVSISRGSSINLNIHHSKVFSSELGTLEWDILNPDQLINLEIKNKRRTSLI